MRVELAVAWGSATTTTAKVGRKMVETSALLKTKKIKHRALSRVVGVSGFVLERSFPNRRLTHLAFVPGLHPSATTYSQPCRLWGICPRPRTD